MRTGTGRRTVTERRSGARASTTTDSHADTRRRRRPRHSCAHYASEDERRWERAQGGQEIGRVPSGRLRLAAGLLLLALPLAVAIWTFGGLAAKRERNNADQELIRDLNSGAAVYARRLSNARLTADRLARSGRVARAFAQMTSVRSGAIEQAHPWIKLRQGSAGGLHGRKVRRASTSSAVKGRSGVSSSSPRLVGLSSGAIDGEAHLPGGRLGFLLDQRLIREDGVGRVDSRPTTGKATDLRLQALEYRAVVLPLGERRGAPALITVRKRSEIAAAADDVRWRVIGLGLGLIGAFLVTAYAVAPAIARSRLSRLQRDQAQRVLATSRRRRLRRRPWRGGAALEPGCRGDHGPPGRGGARPPCGGGDSGLDDDRDVRAGGGSTRGNGRPLELRRPSRSRWEAASSGSRSWPWRWTTTPSTPSATRRTTADSRTSARNSWRRSRMSSGRRSPRCTARP